MILLGRPVRIDYSWSGVGTELKPIVQPLAPGIWGVAPQWYGCGLGGECRKTSGGDVAGWRVIEEVLNVKSNNTALYLKYNAVLLQADKFLFSPTHLRKQ